MISGRALWAGLAVSLALNLFIGGTVAGVLIQRAREPVPEPAPAVPAPAPVTPAAALPQPKAAPPLPAPVAQTPEPAVLPPEPPPPAPSTALTVPAANTPPRPPAGNPLLRAGDKLPPPVRGPYREALRQATQASQPKLQESRRARMEVARLMAQPNFNPEALAAALERSRQAELEARAEVEAAMVRFAANMNLRERRLLAEGLREPPGRGGEGAAPGRGPGRGPGRAGGPPAFQPAPPVQPQ